MFELYECAMSRGEMSLFVFSDSIGGGLVSTKKCTNGKRCRKLPVSRFLQQRPSQVVNSLRSDNSANFHHQLDVFHNITTTSDRFFQVQAIAKKSTVQTTLNPCFEGKYVGTQRNHFSNIFCQHWGLCFSYPGSVFRQHLVDPSVGPLLQHPHTRRVQM